MLGMWSTIRPILRRGAGRSRRGRRRGAAPPLATLRPRGGWERRWPPVILAGRRPAGVGGEHLAGAAERDGDHRTPDLGCGLEGAEPERQEPGRPLEGGLRGKKRSDTWSRRARVTRSASATLRETSARSTVRWPAFRITVPMSGTAASSRLATIRTCRERRPGEHHGVHVAGMVGGEDHRPGPLRFSSPSTRIGQPASASANAAPAPHEPVDRGAWQQQHQGPQRGKGQEQHEGTRIPV